MKNMNVCLRGIVLCYLMFVMANIVAQEVQIKHEVQRGETLKSIAEHYNVSEETIIEANPLIESYYVGLLINIPQKKEVETIKKEAVPNISNSDWRYEQAFQLMSENKYKKAGKIFSLLIEESPSALLYYYRGECYFQREKYKSAIEDFSQAQAMGGLTLEKSTACQELLAKAKDLRQEQLKNRGNMWSGLFAITAATVGAVITAKAQNKASMNKSSSDTHQHVSSASTVNNDESEDNSTTTSSSSSKGTCLKCFGDGVCAKCNGDVHYFDNSFGLAREVRCTYCNGTGKCSSCNGTGKK